MVIIFFSSCIPCWLSTVANWTASVPCKQGVFLHMWGSVSWAQSGKPSEVSWVSTSCVSPSPLLPASAVQTSVLAPGRTPHAEKLTERRWSGLVSVAVTKDWPKGNLLERRVYFSLSFQATFITEGGKSGQESGEETMEGARSFPSSLIDSCSDSLFT